MKLRDVELLLKNGRIRGFSSLPVNNKKLPGKVPLTDTGPKVKLKRALEAWCRENGKPLFLEQRFHVKRMWRFDFLIPGPRPCALEYEGIYSERSRHTHFKGFSGDTDKYREAALAGITVLRYTADNIENVIQDLTTFYHG